MNDNNSSGSPNSSSDPGSRRLELVSIELVGGNRAVEFSPGLNIIIGDITTGKTTLVRLIRALLGKMPSSLPPEVDYVDAIRGVVRLADRAWQVYRPRTTTRNAIIEVGELVEAGRSPTALRLPAAGVGQPYSTFLLDQLGIPAVSVPRARSEPAGAIVPVTSADWLGYCIITGDELDTEIFGSKNDWRDAKRRWVFELAYGYYDPELAELNARLRSIELQLAALEQSSEAAGKFLAGTPFASSDALEQQVVVRTAELQRVQATRQHLTSEAVRIPGVQEVRADLLEMRRRRADYDETVSNLEAQTRDLRDLEKQLASQSAKLTRAIVADEWLVDFDFVVCPRCGSDINSGRSDANHCYLCLQTPLPRSSKAQMLNEQDRIVGQIEETRDVLTRRFATLIKVQQEAESLDADILTRAAELNVLTEAFISDRALQLESLAAEQARVEAELAKLREYLQLLQRYDQQRRDSEQLEQDRDSIETVIHERGPQSDDAEANVAALETRMLEYLRALNIPDLGQELDVKISKQTYLPLVSGRTFDELSSQGLKTLVNVAHALAHHTVAIDRSLPMPGLLVLDGLSANAGHEGFDQARIRDAYRLLRRVSEEYAGVLQIVAVDNLPDRAILLEFVDSVILTLSQEDRLIRLSSAESATTE